MQKENPIILLENPLAPDLNPLNTVLQCFHSSPNFRQFIQKFSNKSPLFNSIYVFPY